MLELHRVTDLAADVIRGYRGIPEPLASLPRVEPADVDWVLVPGVAFDVDGPSPGLRRRLLRSPARDAATGTPKIAGAFDLQVVAHIPSAPHDLRVDTIVTPTRTISTA